MRRRRLAWIAVSLSLAMVAGTDTGAQTVIDPVEDLDFDRTEAWAQKYFTSVTMITGFGAPRSVEPWSVDLGLEAGWVPSLSARERTVGFDGAKTEDLNKTDAFGRVAVTAAFPGKVSTTLVYTPPVEVGGAEPNLLGIAVGRPVYQSRKVRLGVRLHGQTGTIEGDFTCTEEEAAAGNDTTANPFGCEAPSDDEFTTRYAGLELAASFPVRDGRIEPWISGSANYLDTEFQVRARYSGLVDRTTLKTDGWTSYLTAGSDFTLAEDWRIAAELFYSRLDVRRPPSREKSHDDLFNVRVLVRWNLRD
jgi:hypothetical protein